MGTTYKAAGMFVCVLGAIAGRAAADPDAQADALFVEGKRLAATDLRAACAKYRASYERDPIVTTGVVLADCLERDHRLVSAHAMFLEVRRLIERTATGQAMDLSSRQATLDLIVARRAALQPRLSTLTIEVPVAIRVDGLVVTWAHDGATADALAEVQWNAALPLDGGDYAISASAPGYRPWSTTITVEGEHGRALVQVPRLELAVTAAAPASSARGQGQRVAGLAIGGAGVVAVGVGLGFGAVARRDWRDAQAAGCDAAGVCPTEAGVELATDARSAGSMATLAVTVGVVAIGAGVALYLVAPRGREPRVAMIPYLGPSGGGLAVHGGF